MDAVTSLEAEKAPQDTYSELGKLFDKKWDKARRDQLTMFGFLFLTESLRKYRNIPSFEQLIALLELMGTYSAIVQGKKSGRFAFPLSCGLGKTQSIVALIKAVTALMMEDDISITVCASKVEALCDIKRELMEYNVVQEKLIGLIHSYQYDSKVAEEFLNDRSQLPDGYASMPATEDNDERPFLLVTHARVRGKGDTEVFNTFRGKPRNLIIWDETLFISDTRAIAARHFKGGFQYLSTVYGKSKELKPVLEYFSKCLGMIEKAKSGQSLTFPRLSADEVSRYRQALEKDIMVNGGKKVSSIRVAFNAVAKPLRRFLTISQNPVRLIKTSEDDGYLSFDIVVDPELENIVVLDASHNIRELVKLDKTIRQADYCEDIVSYENVKIRKMDHFSGRHTMEKLFGKKDAKDRKISLEIAEVIREIPQDEGVIVFTFKPKGVDFEKILKTDLKSSGVDLEATVPVLQDDEGKTVTVHKPRFVWLTWGNETSLSRYSYCKNVIMAGVLHRSELDLAACACGQSNDLQKTISTRELRSIRESEIAHCLYQALSRGSCRVVTHGTTQPMNVWFFHKGDEIRTILDRVVPEAQWLEWEPKYLSTDGKIRKIASTIEDYLKGLDNSVEKVSTSKIKKELGLKSEPRMTVTCALQSVADNISGWTLQGRSMVRVFGSELEDDF